MQHEHAQVDKKILASIISRAEADTAFDQTHAVLRAAEFLLGREHPLFARYVAQANGVLDQKQKREAPASTPLGEFRPRSVSPAQNPRHWAETERDDDEKPPLIIVR